MNKINTTSKQSGFAKFVNVFFNIIILGISILIMIMVFTNEITNPINNSIALACFIISAIFALTTIFIIFKKHKKRYFIISTIAMFIAIGFATSQQQAIILQQAAIAKANAIKADKQQQQQRLKTIKLSTKSFKIIKYSTPTFPSLGTWRAKVVTATIHPLQQPTLMQNFTLC